MFIIIFIPILKFVRVIVDYHVKDNFISILSIDIGTDIDVALRAAR